MKTKVELEFINKVRELSEELRNLAIFRYENKKELEDLNVSKDYPFSESLEDLAYDAHDWFVTLLNDYGENLQK